MFSCILLCPILICCIETFRPIIIFLFIVILCRISCLFLLLIITGSSEVNISFIDGICLLRIHIYVF